VPGDCALARPALQWRAPFARAILNPLIQELAGGTAVGVRDLAVKD
jgi:hypothetical protein